MVDGAAEAQGQAGPVGDEFGERGRLSGGSGGARCMDQREIAAGCSQRHAPCQPGATEGLSGCHTGTCILCSSLA